MVQGGPDTRPDDLAARRELLDRSAERDLWQRRLLEAWTDGWRVCEAAQGDVYERGYVGGILLRKRVEHDTVRLLRLELRRWLMACGPCRRRDSPVPDCPRCEPRTRATFGQPHPDDRGEAA